MNKSLNGKKILIMNSDLPGAGFGACVLVTINQIRFCERHDHLPVAVYDRNSDNAFFDPAYGNSMWEQYFEPLVDGWSAEAVTRGLVDAAGGLSDDDLAGVSNEELWKELEESSDSVCSFTYAEWRERPPEHIEAWYAEQRAKARETVEKYVRPNRRIREKVDAFWAEHMKSPSVLGVHMRGTDFHYAPPVSPPEYFPLIDDWIRRRPDLQIFLATEQSQYVEIMQHRYGARLVTYDAARSDNEIAPFEMESVGPYRRGEDVLIDILLLSRCEHLLKGASNVGEMAMYFGPSLTCTDLSLGKVKAFGQDYGKGWDFHTSKPAWALIKDTDLGRLAANATNQSRAEWLRSQVRRGLFHGVVRPARKAKKAVGMLARRLGIST